MLHLKESTAAKEPNFVRAICCSVKSVMQTLCEVCIQYNMIMHIFTVVVGMLKLANTKNHRSGNGRKRLVQ